MANLKVNTDGVVATATRIKTLNDQIRDGFSDVQSAISKLDSAWDGSAATNAISKFNEIKSGFLDNRYAVVDNYVNFLLQLVGEGYATTEDINKMLADSFK